jgi:glutathione S-transferase
MAGHLTLYLAPGSSSMAAHIALYEVGAVFDVRAISLAAKQTHTPAFRAINPAAQVPTLVIDGRALTEVAGILYYLARRYPEAALLPSGDIEAEAQVVSWMSFIASTVHPARRAGEDTGRAAFALAEGRLGARDWAVGAYSIADIHLFRLFWRFGKALKRDEGEFPNLSSHYERMMERPAVQRTLAAETTLGYELP